MEIFICAFTHHFQTNHLLRFLFFEKINFSDYEVILLKLFKLSCGFGATDGTIDIFGKN